MAEQQPRPAGTSDEVAFRLVVADGEPVSGRLLVEGARGSEREFSGWIELMAAVNAARRRSDEGGPLGAG